jgi:hypothetical protein
MNEASKEAYNTWSEDMRAHRDIYASSVGIMPVLPALWSRREGGRQTESDNKHPIHFCFPLRAVVYNRYMMSKHRVNWEVYSTLLKIQMATFFDDNAPAVYHDTLRSHFGQVHEPIHHLARRSWIFLLWTNSLIPRKS